MLILAPSAGAMDKAIWGPIYRHGVDQFPLYHRLGVRIYETELRWAEVAPVRPRNPTDPADAGYAWPGEIDQALAKARHFHMRVLLQIIGAPAWANGGHADPGWAPRHPIDLARFATAAAHRYPGVQLWMIWGEPTKDGSFQPMDDTPPGHRPDATDRGAAHLYARILDAAYGALKSVNRRNLVIGGSTWTAGAVDPLHWIENLRLRNGHAPRMDMYAHNPFGDTFDFSAPPSPFDTVQYSDLPELAGWVDRYLRRGLPLFLSEWTIPTAPDDTFNFYIDPRQAAADVRLALREARRWRRIYGVGWVNVYDDPPRTRGGLLTAQGRPKPDYWAFAHG